MKRFSQLCLFVALFLTIGVSLSWALDCSDSNIVPGAKLLMSGFDARNGANFTAPGESAGMLPIFLMNNFDYSQSYSPPGRKDINWCVPDDIWANSIGQSVLYIGQSYNAKYEEVVKTYASRFSFGISVEAAGFKGAINYEHQLQKGHSHLENMNEQQGHSYRRYAHYSLQAFPPNLLTMHPAFRRELQVLPDEINNESDAAQYQLMMSYFGTHYVTRIIMGGTAVMDTYVVNSLIQDKGYKWVSNQLSLQFSYKMFGIDSGLFKNRSEIHISEEFLANSQTYNFFSGGNPLYQQNGTLPEWAASTVDAPAALNYSLTPLDTLFPTATKAKTMRKAIENYMNTGAVQAPMQAAQKYKSMEPVSFGGVGIGFEWKEGLSTLPVMAFTYNEQKTWTFPQTGEILAVPDQLVVTNTPEANLAEETAVVASLVEFEHTMRKWHSISIGVPGVIGFNDWKGKGVVERMLKSQNTKLYVIRRIISLYKVQMWPLEVSPSQDHSIFKKEIEMLPDNCDDNPNLCDQFIQAWGEFYAPEGHFGGEVWYFMNVNQSLIQQYNASWVDHQVSLYVQFVDWKFGIGKGYNKTHNSASEIFISNTEINIMWHNWNDSSVVVNNTEIYENVVEKPLMIRPRLEPITDLIVGRPALKASLQGYINAYLQRSDLSASKVTRKFWEFKQAQLSRIPVSYPVKVVNRAKDTPEYPEVPGTDFLGCTFDAVYAVPRGMPVYKYSYKYGQTWKNPLYPALQYKVPDQVAVVDNPTSSFLKFQMIYSNATNYISQQYSSHTKRGFMGFHSKSKQTYDFYQRYYQLDQQLLLNYTSHAWYQLKVYPIPPPPIEESFKAAVSLLPPTWNADKNSAEYSAYHKFLKTFGTHYMSTAIMGGTMKQVTWFDRCFVSTYSDHWVSKQSGWSFFNIASNKHGSHSENVCTTADWDEYSSVTVDLKGGNPILYKAQELDDWTKSIKTNMNYVDYDMELLSDLITWDPARSKALLEAIEDYVKTNYDESLADSQKFIPENPHDPPAWCKPNN